MIAGTVGSKGSLKRVVNDLMYYDVKLIFLIEQIALVARSVIYERLETHLGSSAEHFNVTIRPNGFGYSITVSAKDEVGSFLFHGVEPHEISGVSMPIGNGKFAQVVKHPGYDSKYPEIERAVLEGIAAAIVMVDG